MSFGAEPDDTEQMRLDGETERIPAQANSALGLIFFEEENEPIEKTRTAVSFFEVAFLRLPDAMRI